MFQHVVCVQSSGELNSVHQDQSHRVPTVKMNSTGDDITTHPDSSSTIKARLVTDLMISDELG